MESITAQVVGVHRHMKQQHAKFLILVFWYAISMSRHAFSVIDIISISLSPNSFIATKVVIKAIAR